MKSRTILVLFVGLVLDFHYVWAAPAPGTEAPATTTNTNTHSSTVGGSIGPTPTPIIAATSPTSSTTKFNLKIVPRTAWRAAPPHQITSIAGNIIAIGEDDIDEEDWLTGKPKKAFASEPTEAVPYVIIHHTAIPGACNSSPTCQATLRSMQRYHQEDRKWDDIGYNFLIGGGGGTAMTEAEIYEGRGFNVRGAHTYSHNAKSVGIALIGNWEAKTPPASMLQKLKDLIQYGVEKGYIAPNYKLMTHRQFSATLCPGQMLQKELETWEHYSTSY